MICRCSSSACEYLSPIRCRSCVEPSMSLNKKVTVPEGFFDAIVLVSCSICMQFLLSPNHLTGVACGFTRFIRRAGGILSTGKKMSRKFAEKVARNPENEATFDTFVKSFFYPLGKTCSDCKGF